MKQYILITGASSGIGRAAAFAFAARGENLILVARRQERLDEIKQQINAKFPDISVVVEICDLGVRESVYELYERLGKFDLKALINNAGFGDRGEVCEKKLPKILQMLDLNITALTILSTLFATQYQDKPTKLINISSFVGYKIIPNYVPYCASKFYVSAFSEGLQREMVAKGAKMQVKILAPAATKSEFANVAADDASYDYSDRNGHFHTSDEMAQFLLQLYDSDLPVGFVEAKSLKFELCDFKMPFIG